MSLLEIDVDGKTYTGELFDSRTPASIDAMREFLPLESELKHVRWSGHAIWVNIDNIDLPDVPRENHTVYPSRGDVLFYPGYRNEQEILISCGPTCFKSPAGELAGNHVATISASPAELRSLEDATLNNGKYDVTIRIREDA
ncbi:DUF3830 family protein [Halorubrum trueperi]|uniref:DUF3830 family protein n=1 Tax=Halorubrum trueperi TaxID=2004704 RepID=A0ABD5UHA6_9EURY